MHGEDDQICPFATPGGRSVKLLKHGTPTTHEAVINPDLLAFIRG